MNSNNLLLAVESSCDETAFSLYNIETEEVLFSLIHSQINIHEKNGGVIPDLAAHYHYHLIYPLLLDFLLQSQKTLSEISYFAATNGPGLPGALLIGYTFMKGIAWGLKRPFLGINHLTGHIYAPFLNNKNIPFPHLCLSVSGGHTSVYMVDNFLSYQCLGSTRDDAAGECFDKIAKLLNLPYPGGKYIEALANNKELKNIRKYSISVLDDGSISFSGLKTAVLYDIINSGYYNSIEKKIKIDTPQSFITEVAVSVQYVINQMLKYFVSFFVKKSPNIKGITLTGGVACNGLLQKEISEFAALHDIHFFSTEKKYCCDNADMIAFVAAKKIQANRDQEKIYTEGIFS